MSAETLRRAAALMRERAEGARYFYSSLTMRPGEEVPWPSEEELRLDFDEEQAPHIASWHPTVGLVVADWLAGVADKWTDDPGCDLGGGYDFSPACESCFRCAYYETQMRALTVARAYLGEQP